MIINANKGINYSKFMHVIIFKYISIIVYYFMLWSKNASIYGLLYISKTLRCLMLIIFKIIIIF